MLPGVTPLGDYLAELKRNLDKGIATEHTYRPFLERLLEACGKDVDATNEPRRIACGAPDFIVTRKKTPLGYVETKDIGTNLDEMARGRGPHGEQFVRYRDGLANWMLTDYLEFRWFVGGEPRLALRVAEVDARGKLRPLPDAEPQLAALLNAFYEQPALTIGTARELAVRMAALTRILRDLINATFRHEAEELEKTRLREAAAEYGAGKPRGPWLHAWLSAFRETLIPDLTEADFADMFAQTLAYGLFAARIHTPANKEFTREMAAYRLPKTNPFLRKLFHEIAGVDMPDTIAWAVDDLVDLLRHADMHEILRDFGKGKGREDPIVHFYETFLAAYDPKLREGRGVYYTPEPVVGWIVRSLDRLLQSKFDRPGGLADEKTLILDPAAGTATFLYSVLNEVYARFAKQKGAWDGYVENHLLNRLFGFELLMAPYAIAHLKLGMRLEETGYGFGGDRRLGVFLTNTLEQAAHKSEQLYASWISEEADAASEVKSKAPIMVVLGNPPYANFGRMNRNPWILKLLEDYKKDLNEKKLNLDDDFIKFLRFAQWRIERTGHGLIGFITNNTYLDGITHRRLRRSLMEAFDELYVLNLHGSSKKKEKTPEGGKDENVFDITVGVSILLAVKKGRAEDGLAGARPSSARLPDGSVEGGAPATPEKSGAPGGRALPKVLHADLWGRREQKYEWLGGNDAESTKWTELKPTEPYWFFVPKDTKAQEEYGQGVSLKDAFVVSGSGVKTERDSLSIHFERASLVSTVSDFLDLEEGEIRRKYGLQKDSRDWKLKKAITDLRENNSANPIHPVLYRPFDVRVIWYSGRTRGFVGTPGFPCMKHMIAGNNLAFLAMRQVSVGEDYNHFSIARFMTDNRAFYSSKGILSVFPLYVYDETNELKLGTGPRPNFTPSFVSAVEGALGMKMVVAVPDAPRRGAATAEGGVFTPEDVFHYAYAVFHSPTYRARYAEFLKIDFPRLPLTADRELFFRLAGLGAELAGLHLMESPKLNDFITSFPEKGDNTVEKVSYAGGRVHINSTQYFDGVPEAVWNFHVGGYQVCEKWLKDRKGRALSYEDVRHYQKIVVALSETLRLMAEIDRAIPGWPIG
ncbi:MAG: N-6 DNA methylase [Kiritimatiellae bacterium]|nr:N-6 DNA methylase [Kiritimatiellia bacterium]